MSTFEPEMGRSPTPPAKLPLSHFSRFGAGSLSLPPTRYVGYSIGIRLAWAASKAGIGPNAISLLGFFVGIISVVAAGLWIDSPLSGSVVLLVGLQLSYALDCADGVAARATGRCTPFGALLDKVLDGILILLIPMVLALGAQHRGWLDPIYVAPLIAISAVPRLATALANWMKGYETGTANDRMAPDGRPRTMLQIAARVVATILDAPVYRFGIAVFWGLGLFVPFAVCFGCFTCLALLLYLVKSAREM